MLRLFTYILFFSFCSSMLSAQETLPYAVSHYTTENGLPSNGIKGIQWDEKSGFLWIASEGGLSRFNGISFKNFNRSTTPFFETERVPYIQKTSTGIIYGPDFNSNIFYIDQNIPKPLKNEIDFTRYNLNQLLFYTLDKSLFLNISQHPLEIDFSYLTGKVIQLNDSAILIDYKLQLFYQTQHQKKPMPIFEGLGEIDIFKIGNKSFLLNANNKILQIASSKGRTPFLENVLYNKDVSNYLQNCDKIYWEPGMENPILTKGKNAWLLSLNDGKIEATLICNALPVSVLINFIQYSVSRHLLFVGTNSTGLYVIKKNQVKSLKNPENTEKKQTTIYSQIEFTKNTIVTNNGTVFGNKSTTTLPFTPSDGFTYNVYQTKDSSIWFTGVSPQNSTIKACLQQYNYKTKKLTNYPKIVTLNDHFGLIEMNDSLYYANSTGIGVLLGDSVRFYYLFDANKEKSLFVYDINKDADNNILLATCDGILSYNKRTNSLFKNFESKGFCIRTLTYIDDYLFIGTYGNGYFIMKNNKIVKMPIDQNNYLRYTHCFVSDTKGFIWMSTNRGLFRASKKDLMTAFEKNSTEVYYHYLGRNDGMEMAELNGGCTPCALKLNNGYFSFPTMDGLVWVNPETVDPILPIGEIFIDEINVDNKIITVDSFSKNPLKSGIKDVSFQIGFSSWGNIENMNLEYQLNDAAIWKPFNINQEGKLTFSNLPHGNYELKIRKANGFGLNNFASKAIRFTIEKPWYMENWFILLALIVFSILIILTINLRTHQLTQQQHKLESQVKDKTKELQENNDVLEKSNLLKTRLISIISHDIITPLKFVHIAGKNLLEKQHIISPTLQQETIQEITNTSGELHLLSTNILNWIKYQHEDRRLEKEQFYPNAVVSQLFNILQSVAEQKQLILENTIDKDIRLFQMIEPFKIVVYNLILNAINFTAKGNITISAKVANQRLNITVEDKGIGMTKEQIHNIMSDQFIVSSANVNNRKGNGLGYLIVKDLIKIMNAELQITSEKYKGTTITVSIPGINE